MAIFLETNINVMFLYYQAEDLVHGTSTGNHARATETLKGYLTTTVMEDEHWIHFKRQLIF